MGKIIEFVKNILIPTALADTGGQRISYIRNYPNDVGIFGVDGEENDPIVKSPEQFGFIYPGYEFVEWNTSQDGTGRSFAVGSSVGNTYYTLYAIWQENNTRYIVSHGDLTDIADAIRAKTGGTASLSFPADFISNIGNLTVLGVQSNTKEFKKQFNSDTSIAPGYIVSASFNDKVNKKIVWTNNGYDSAIAPIGTIVNTIANQNITITYEINVTETDLKCNMYFKNETEETQVIASGSYYMIPVTYYTIP